MTTPDTVGELRAQSAHLGSDKEIVLVTEDPELKALVRDLRVVRSYPDTTDRRGSWNSTFKIEVRRARPEEE